jgi:phosphomethylpyrimidine synthase
MENGPDIIADLSIVPTTKPLWQIVLEAGFTASTLPIYTTTRKGSVVDPEELLEIALTQMEAGVGLLTIHPTATREIISATDKRLTPWTSRGGGIVIRDLLARDSNENVYSVILPDLINAAKKYGAALSIGASFRSANIFDSRDTAQLGEIEAQIRIANIISAQGVGVIIESPGHARPIDIQLTARQLAATGIPIMPLGPIPTDAAVGFDHVAAAIGATIMGMEGAAHVLAAVTREEHTGGIPSVESTIEAVRSARVAAHIIGIHRLGLTQIDAGIVNERVKHRTCVAGKQTHGCSRCGPVCPL